MFINQKSLTQRICILRISDEHRRDFYWRNPQPYAVSKGEPFFSGAHLKIDTAEDG